MLWNHIEVCSVFCSAATRYNICYQTIGKAISAGFKTQISSLIFKLFPEKGFALSKYSPVTLHYSAATAILNETTDQDSSTVYVWFFY